MENIEKLKDLIYKNNFKYDFEMGSIAQIIVNECKQQDNETKVFVLIAYALKAEYFGNASEYRYCMMKANQVIKKSKMQIDSQMKEFFESNLTFLASAKKALANKLIMMEVVMFAILVLVLMIFFRNYLAMVLSIATLLTGINALMIYQRVYRTFDDVQIMQLENQVEDLKLLDYIKGPFYDE